MMFLLIKNNRYDNFINKLIINMYFIYQLFIVLSVSAFARENSLIYKFISIIMIFCFFSIILCIIYYFFRGLYTRKEIIIPVLIGMILLISFLNYHSVMVIANIFAVLAFKNLDTKKVLKAYLYAVIIGFIINVALGILTPYNGNVSQIRNGVERIRYGLGFFWTAFGPFYYTSLVLAYMYVKSKFRIFDYAMLIIFTIILYVLTDTKAPFFYVLLSLFLYFIFSHNRYEFLYKLFGRIAILSYTLFFMIVYLLAIFYNSSINFFTIINKILSGRLMLTNSALNMYGFKIFGQNVPVVNGGATHVDSSMISMLMLNGLIVLLISLIFMTYFTYITYKTKNISLLIALFIIAFRSSFDLGFMALQLSPFVVAFLPTFYEYKNIKNNVYSNDNNYI